MNDIEAATSMLRWYSRFEGIGLTGADIHALVAQWATDREADA